MCRGGGHGSILFLSLMCHVGAWLFHVCFSSIYLLFLLLPLKIKKIPKKCTTVVCRGGGHGSILFLSLFVLLLPHVSCWSMTLLFVL